MDKVLDALTVFNPALSGHQTAKEQDSAARSYFATLQKLPDAGRQIIQHTPQPFFQLLDPELNSIGYLYILDIVHNTPTTQPAIDRKWLQDETLQFLLKFDPQQMRYVGTLFRNLLELIASGTLFSPRVSIELLAHVILRIDPTSSVFTSAHLLMVKLAYDTNCVEPTLKVIDSDILFYPPTSRSMENKMLYDREDLDADAPPSAAFNDAVKASSVLEYQLLRSLIYISRRDWAKAQAALEQIITHPVKEKGVSKIMADSYKKWVLVGLLNEGRAPTLPSSVYGGAKNAYTTLSSAYNDVAVLFHTDDASQLKATFAEHTQTWLDDGNATLIEEVKKAYQKWHIINLRRIYHQLSVSQIRNATLSAETAAPLKDDQETLNLISGMIASGMLKGSFKSEEYESMTEGEFTKSIAQSHHNIEALSRQYRIANDRLSVNKEYLKFVLREQKRSDKDGGDGGIGFEAPFDDEDLMTGVVSHAA
ncbi:COP9 signalosome complex subunit 3 [Cladobotryum mycophilum]|uniref:COP9 signalosome complex subunit 3 n=1 Tax=Cladobotryum mycophilum TaxID=491253 RepID=A0ABR0S524_9HYPO